jgi:hypothetical protein
MLKTSDLQPFLSQKPIVLIVGDCMYRGFPGMPPIAEIDAFQPAFDHIQSCDWQQSLQATTTGMLDATALESELRAAHQVYDQDLANGNWQQSFSGKEIFRVLVSRIYDVPRVHAARGLR